MKAHLDIIDEQIDEIMCWFDFARSADVLKDCGWMADEEENVLEGKLRQKALQVLRRARNHFDKYAKDSTDEVVTLYIDQYPFLVRVTVCRADEKKWAKIDLYTYVEGTINDGEEYESNH